MRPSTSAASTFAYTNHTVMSEALEKWNERHLPHHPAPHLPDRAARWTAAAAPSWPRHSPVTRARSTTWPSSATTRCAWPTSAAYVCHAINGVSKLHSEIIKDSVFHDYYLYKPNAVQERHQRHRLPPLAAAVQPRPDQPAGGDHRRRLQDGCLRAEEAGGLRGRQDRARAAAAKVKRENKAGLRRTTCKKTTGQVIDPDSIFDVPGQAHARVQAPAPERPEHRGRSTCT